MNEGHQAVCASDEWRQMVREQIIPWALGAVDLGDDVLEIGPGYGATTEVLCELVPRLTAIEIDEGLAADLAARFDGTNVTVLVGDATALVFEPGRFSGATSFNMLHHVPSAPEQDRVFAEMARVLRPGGVAVLGDSIETDDLRAFHDGDTFVPVDPGGLAARLTAAGFDEVEVRTNPFGWAAVARRC